MPKYPQTLGVGDLKRYEHIPDAEVARDIAETEAEIDQLRRQQRAGEEIACVSPSDAERRMAGFKSLCRPLQITEREEFVAFLQLLRRARQERAEAAHV